MLVINCEFLILSGKNFAIRQKQKFLVQKKSYPSAQFENDPSGLLVA